jgi:hypothetical protein
MRSKKIPLTEFFARLEKDGLKYDRSNETFSKKGREDFYYPLPIYAHQDRIEIPDNNMAQELVAAGLLTLEQVKWFSEPYIVELFKLGDFPPEKQRVIVAEDVLAAIRAKHLTPTNGQWAPDGIPDLAEDNNIQMSEILPLMECEACALGSIFVCAVERFNKVKTIYDPALHDMLPMLKKIFSLDQLMLIELAFEQGGGHYTEYDFGALPEYRDESQIPKRMALQGREAVVFGHRFDDPTKRLQAIMRNIIQNEGTFVPPKLRKDELASFEAEREQALA